MGQAAVDLPDPLESPPPAAKTSTDDLLSQLAGDHPAIQEMDLNPLRVMEPGRGCLALDARIAKEKLSGGRGGPDRGLLARHVGREPVLWIGPGRLHVPAQPEVQRQTLRDLDIVLQEEVQVGAAHAHVGVADDALRRFGYQSSSE